MPSDFTGATAGDRHYRGIATTVHELEVRGLGCVARVARCPRHLDFLPTRVLEGKGLAARTTTWALLSAWRTTHCDHGAPQSLAFCCFCLRRQLNAVPVGRTIAVAPPLPSNNTLLLLSNNILSVITLPYQARAVS